MSTKYRFRDSHVPHFITMTLVEWIDLFSREKYKELMIENLKFYQKNSGLIVHGYVIMTNHMHMIASSGDKSPLSEVIRSLKRFAAREIYHELQNDDHESRRRWLIQVIEENGMISGSNINYQVWEHENHPVILNFNSIRQQKLNYTHYNPVKAGICFKPEDYKYSSARDYAGEKGLLDLVMLELYKY